MITLSPRLEAAAGYARAGRFAADVGTDHAFLPVALVERGISRGAVASDINRGPLERARKNIAAAGLDGKISTVLTDGLNGLAPFAPEDIFILGMGGELIAQILSASDLPRAEGTRLILQPMTHAQDLRAYLAGAGFAIRDEVLVRDASGERERIYQVLCAEYDGEERAFTPAELVLGKGNIARADAVTAEYAAYVCGVYRVRAEGLTRAGRDASAELELIRELEEIIHDCK